MTPEMKQALVRGLFHAGLVGAMSFLTIWTDPTISMRGLITAALVPAITVLGTRFIGEGWYDSAKAVQVGTPQSAARTQRLVNQVGTSAQQLGTDVQNVIEKVEGDQKP